MNNQEIKAMTYTSRSMFTVPLTSKVFKLAKSFQSQYENPAKAQQVYLNTLAVYAVETYCDCLGIETDLEDSDSLNPVMQPLMNIADLEIDGIGKIECRPVSPTDEKCYIPVETWENRIGYVAVEIDESSREATLLGFYPPVNALEMIEYISLDIFQPLEALIDHLDRLESALDFFQSDDPVVIKVKERLTDEPFSEIVTQLERIYRTYNKYERRYAGGEFLASYLTLGGVAFRGGVVAAKEDFDESQQIALQDLAEELLDKLDEIWGGDESEETVNIEQPAIVPLSQPQANLTNYFSEWLQNLEDVFLYTWQTIESYLSNQEENLILTLDRSPRSRTFNSVIRAKSIDLPIQPTGISLAWIISVTQRSSQEREIKLQWYPLKSQSLPIGLKSVASDEFGQTICEVQAKNAEPWMQINIDGKQGEMFRIKLELGAASITEYFII
jgi:hypothetical protein